LTTPQFVRYHLMQLKVGNELTQVQRGKDHVRTLATVDEVLALCPELQSAD